MKTTISCLALALLPYACASCSHVAVARAVDPAASQPSDDPQETVRYLLSLRHGPQRSSEKGRSLYAQLSRHPARYEEAVRHQLALPDEDDTLREWGEGHKSAQLARAVNLAEALGREHGGPMVLDFLRAVQQRVANVRNAVVADLKNQSTADEESERVLRTLRLLLAGTLTAMTNLKDPSGIEDVLTAVALEEDSATRFVMLRYLQAVAPDDKKISAALRRMVNDPASPMHDDPDALRVLRQMGAEG